MYGVDQLAKLGPFVESQGDSFTRRFHFRAVVRFKELPEIHTEETGRHRHVVTAADVALILNALALCHFRNVVVDFMNGLTELSPSTEKKHTTTILLD